MVRYEKYLWAVVGVVTVPTEGTKRRILSFRRASHSQEDKDCPIHANHVFVAKAAHLGTQSFLRDCRELIDHKATWDAQAVLFRRFNGDSKEGSLGGVRGEGTDGDGSGGVETVILDDDCRTWFPSVVSSPRDGPNLTTFHIQTSSETASMNV